MSAERKPGGRASRQDPPLVGREAVLAALSATAADALAGAGSLTLLVGEAGSGKTRIAQESLLAAERRGFEVVSSHCPEAEGVPAFWPWAQLLRGLVARDPDRRGRAESHHPFLALLASREAPSRGEPEDAGERLRVVEALADLLLLESRSRPIALLIDDLHAADLASLHALEVVARRAGEGRLWLVATSRVHALHGDDATAAVLSDLATRVQTCDVTPLREDEVALLLDLIVGSAPSTDLARTVAERTGGNPLLVVELARAIVASPDGASLPADARGLAGALRHRLLPLPAEHRELLAVASLLGRDFDPALVAQTAEVEEESVEAAIEAGLAHRLLLEAPDGSVSFSHALVRDHLRDALPRSRRRTLHRRAAERLEARADAARQVERILYHVERGDDAGVSDRTLEYRLRAANAAAARLAWEDAAALLGSTLAEHESRGAPLTRRAEVALELGLAHARCGETGAAEESFERAWHAALSAGSARLAARAAIGAAGDVRTGNARQGVDPRRAERMTAALAALLEEHDEDEALRARLQTMLAMELYWSGDFERIRGLLEAPRQLASRTDDVRLRADLLLGAAIALWTPENLSERLALCEEAIALGEQSGDLAVSMMGHHLRSVGRLEASDGAGADADRARARGLSERLRYPLQRHYSDNAEVIRLIACGRFPEAEALSRSALQAGVSLGSPHATALHGSHMLLLTALRGRATDVLGPLRLLAAQAEIEFPRASLVWIECLAGEQENARAGLRAFMQAGLASIRPDFFAPGCLALLAESAAHLGEAAACEELYERMAPYAGRAVVVGYATAHLGCFDRYLGALAHGLGRFDAAAEHLDAAIVSDRRAGNRAWLALALEGRAALLETNAHDARAASLRAEAAALRGELGLAMALLPVSVGSGLGAEPAPRYGEASFERAGAGWRVVFAGRSITLDDSRGCVYLAHLLERPDEHVHVLDLVALVAPELEAGATGGGMEVLDARARQEYRDRISSLQEELDEAEAHNDLSRAERAREELDTIAGLLAGALGLGGRSRRAGNATERARKAVYNRIRSVTRRLETVHPELGSHLRNSIRTGRTCSYRPERAVAWHVVS